MFLQVWGIQPQRVPIIGHILHVTHLLETRHMSHFCAEFISFNKPVPTSQPLLPNVVCKGMEIGEN